MVKCNQDQVKRLKKAVQREKDPVVRQRIQMILLREDGKTQPEIAELTGVSLSTVNRAHMAYDNAGVNALQPKPTGGRRNENMTLEEERKFLARFAKAAGAGELLNIRTLKLAYEKEIGIRRARVRSTISWHAMGGASSCRVRFILSGMRRRKKLIKKAFRQAVKKARRIAAARGRALQVMFADEE